MNMARHLRVKHPIAYENYKSQTYLTRASNGEGLIKYFKKLANSRYQCNVCSLILIVPTEINNNLKAHMETKHSDIFSAETNNTDLQCDKNLDTLSNSKNYKMRSLCWVRKYCRRINVRRYQCLVCGSVLSLSNGSLANMKRHFKHKHPPIFDEEKNTTTFTIYEVALPTKSEKNLTTSNIVEENICEEDDHTEPVIEDSVDVNTDVNVTGLFTLSNKLETKKDEEPTIQNTNETEQEINTDTNNTTETKTLDEYIELALISESNPDLEQKVKELCEKTVLGKRKNKTCIWNFFKAIDEHRLYACFFCGKIITIFPQSVGNLRRHISLRHKKPYSIILKYEETQDNNPVKLQFKSSEKSLQAETENFEKTYFDVDDENDYKCKICSMVVSCLDSDRTVLFNHIKEEHPDEILSYVETPSTDDSLNIIINDFK
ncbi:uncharacterized protein LOC113518765 [Galleria mellonella]|uniref:Uncharacterized protein LOC113518765 n=1 Tax=Galleria mellonella TaxID=7137 RepID=A0A6J1X1R5_GALME|nr:uncharacterized protein LOC113518765 [Galleria mellonella]